MPLAHKASLSIEGARGFNIYPLYGEYYAISTDGATSGDEVAIFATRPEMEALSRAIEAFLMEIDLLEKGRKLDVVA